MCTTSAARIHDELESGAHGVVASTVERGSGGQRVGVGAVSSRTPDHVSADDLRWSIGHVAGCADGRVRLLVASVEPVPDLIRCELVGGGDHRIEPCGASGGQRQHRRDLGDRHGVSCREACQGPYSGNTESLIGA